MRRIAFLFLVLAGVGLNAQVIDIQDMKGAVVVGGNLGFGASDYVLIANVAPQVGKRLTENLECGMRLSYNMNHFFRSAYNDPYTLNYFGAGVYANYEFFRTVFVHVEDEALYKMVFYNKSYVPDESRWYNSVFVGGGYRQYASDRSFVQLSVLWNLNDFYDPITGDSSPYTNPVFRVGYFFVF